jgi:hypothetical protein
VRALTLIRILETRQGDGRILEASATVEALALA